MSKEPVEVQVAKNDSTVHNVQDELVYGHYFEKRHGPDLLMIFKYNVLNKENKYIL